MKIKRDVSVAAALLTNIQAALASNMSEESKQKLRKLQYSMAQKLIANEAPHYMN